MSEGVYIEGLGPVEESPPETVTKIDLGWLAREFVRQAREIPPGTNPGHWDCSVSYQSIADDQAGDRDQQLEARSLVSLAISWATQKGIRPSLFPNAAVAEPHGRYERFHDGGIEVLVTDRDLPDGATEVSFEFFSR